MNESTLDNLRAAFKEYSADNRRCFAHAQKAADEKYPGAAQLFRALARSCSIQAANLLKRSGGIQSTVDNIRQARMDERGIRLVALAGFISRAEADGAVDARIAFEWSQGAGESYAAILDKALAQVEAGSDCSLGALHVCAICGYLVEGEPLDACPNCGVGKRLIPAVE